MIDLYEELTGIRMSPESFNVVNLADALTKPVLINDVAFLTTDNRLLVLIEHQSTINENMNFRLLEYYVELCSKFIAQTKANKFGKKQIQLPKAEFFVVYNGKDKIKELPTLDLGDVKVSAKIYDIHFENLKKKDRDNALAAYARLIDLEKELGINLALEKLLEEGFLTDFFGRKGYKDMFIELFSYESELKEVGRVEGLEQGATNERYAIIRNMLENGLDITIISSVTGASEEEIKNLIH